MTFGPKFLESEIDKFIETQRQSIKNRILYRLTLSFFQFINFRFEKFGPEGPKLRGGFTKKRESWVLKRAYLLRNFELGALLWAIGPPYIYLQTIIVTFPEIMIFENNIFPLGQTDSSIQVCTRYFQF